jgi:hypothetical protein
VTNRNPDPLEELDAISARVADLDRERDDLLTRAKALIVKALKAGAMPTEVARRSPYSDAHIRTLARAAGIEATGRGKRRPPVG